MSKQTLELNEEQIEFAAKMLRAVSHNLRLTIMKFIDEHERVHVNKIYKTLDLEQSITSQHLAELRRVGLVKTQKEGKFVFYTLDYEAVNKVSELIADFFQIKN